MTRSEASVASSSSICKPVSISNDRPVCLDSCRATSRKASRSLCWTCPDNRITMGCEENEASASSRSYKRQNYHQTELMSEAQILTRDFPLPRGPIRRQLFPSPRSSVPVRSAFSCSSATVFAEGSPFSSSWSNTAVFGWSSACKIARFWAYRHEGGYLEEL